jgi:hypothetical protein
MALILFILCVFLLADIGSARHPPGDVLQRRSSDLSSRIAQEFRAISKNSGFLASTPDSQSTR